MAGSPGIRGLAETTIFLKRKPRKLQANSNVFHRKQLTRAENQCSLGKLFLKPHSEAGFMWKVNDFAVVFS